ncbi:metalloregulator ArsR/SmtB family transcription factor [Rhizobium sp. DKSPLA3]|uniref:Metalloregulator ArsR/SmtB family transcription factor n=1 Tax=Rhizobium quercicola TaxID=2901226 RepID=A0A9X1NVG3_9HYPH|nr:metalloregulator ArsR/SmtB family transcription factor [Rhizobium quercicola]MCD7110464.1 metalloregulator ArsR/SmtB family transcription factor [Rhizobium quercicola]
MQERQALASFAALSQGTRLNIVRVLVVAGPGGMAAGAVAERVGVSASNVSFHLKELESAGLVSQRRESRSMVYSANRVSLSELVRFLLDDCCAGQLQLLPLSAEAGAVEAERISAKSRAKRA